MINTYSTFSLSDETIAMILLYRVQKLILKAVYEDEDQDEQYFRG